MNAAIRAGNVLADKYRVDRTLGVGGFGIVLAATHVHLDEKVAIKVLLPRAAKNQEATTRFVREAKAAVRIRSEHVARVTDVGTLDIGLPYIVMEYLDGEDLSAVVKSSGPQSIGDVVEWVLQATEALAEAHALGMVHRDLKPANLFLTRRLDGTANIKVLDFGISKIESLSADDKGMTKTTDVMGSPYYMSPEQMKSSRNVDARADIWALGTILFELLAGVPPFDGETMPALLATILQEPPRDLNALRADVPAGLLAAILRCLEKDPNQRFANVGEMAVALAPFGPPACQGSVARIGAALNQAGPVMGVTPVPSVSTPPPTPEPTTTNAASWAGTVSPTGTGSPAPKSKTALFAGMGLFAIAALSVGAIAAWRLVPEPTNDGRAISEEASGGGSPSEDESEREDSPDSDTEAVEEAEPTTDVAALKPNVKGDNVAPPSPKPTNAPPAVVAVKPTASAPTTSKTAAIKAPPIQPDRPLSATGAQPVVPQPPPSKPAKAASSDDMFGSQQ